MKNKTIHNARVAGAGCHAVNVLRVASVVAVTETVTIGSRVYEAWLGGTAVTAGRITVDVSAGGTKASGTLTWNNSNAVADGETVTIDTKVYTFKTTLTGVEGQVLRLTGGDDALLNLIRAINHTGTPGTDYVAAAVHPTVSAAVAVTAHAFAVTALLTGTGPNTIATTETATGLSWGAATLASGANPTGAQFVTAMALAINANELHHGATAIGTNELLVFSNRGGNTTLPCTETLAGSNNAWHSATMYGAHPQKQIKQMHVARVPIAGEVTLGNMHFHFPFAVGFVLPQIRVTSTGVSKAWDGATIISGNRVTLDNTGSTDWAATDTVYVIATE